MKARDKGIVAVVALVAFAFSRRSSATPAQPAAPAPGPPTPRPPPTPAPSGAAQTVARVNTGGGSAWAKARSDALSRAGITGEEALSILAQWAFETDSGRAEWNNNVGNLKAFGSQARVDLGSAGLFRAFDTLDAGVDAYLALVQNAKFKPAFDLLVADPLSDAWVRKLGALGYYEAPQDTYAAGWQARRTQLALGFFVLLPDDVQ